jgi:hypothetical protein
MIANDDVVIGGDLITLSTILSASDVWIDRGRVCPLQDSIDTVITVPLVPIGIADV